MRAVVTRVKSASVEIDGAVHASIGKGYVIYQQYQANSQLDKGTAIDLQVSSGPEPEPEPAPAPSGEGGDQNNGG